MIEKLAELAMLSLTEDEAASLEKDIRRILDYIEKLKKVDIKGVEPTFHPNQTYLPLREDEVRKSLKEEAVFQNAPEKQEGFFVVKKVVSYEP